jgi:cAMP-dependent protein kinase regulator
VVVAVQEVPLLRSLDAAERIKAVDALQPQTFRAGEQIMEEGETGELFFIVEEGEVVVSRRDKNGQNKEVARKRRGDYFGGAQAPRAHGGHDEWLSTH